MTEGCRPCTRESCEWQGRSWWGLSLLISLLFGSVFSIDSCKAFNRTASWFVIWSTLAACDCSPGSCGWKADYNSPLKVPDNRATWCCLVMAANKHSSQSAKRGPWGMLGALGREFGLLCYKTVCGSGKGFGDLRSMAPWSLKLRWVAISEHSEIIRAWIYMAVLAECCLVEFFK